MIFLLLPIAAAVAFAVLLFVVATHKPFVSPRERWIRILLRAIPFAVVAFALFGRRRRVSQNPEVGGTE